MHELSLPAPAKLNLFLHITGRRADGYHTLQTVFQFIDQADELHFSLRDDGDITLSPGIPGVASADNLIVRAARALQAASGCRLGADIRLDKRLPMGGGLGGGSSDAATTLLALNTLWQTGLDEEALASLGLRLGADVPVFIRGHAAWAEGVGEALQAVDLPEPWYVVLCPDAHIATAAAFAHPELTRNTTAITLRAFFAGAGHNDFEPVVRQLSPAVDAAMSWLAQHGPARMTGTGACLFLACPSRDAAADILAASPVSGFICRGLNRSPAHSALDRQLRPHRI
ncbi:MAG: 4-(cytidine 5'-diphospho)-2-C-methyl-D-erythritol kinase [Perlucidibaca sp.]